MIRASVKIRGCVPALMAAFSAGKSEGVEAEGRQDGLAQHGPVAHVDVAEGVDPHVALVGRARRVRVHAQGVVALASIVVVDLVRAVFEPAVLPLLLDFHYVKRPRHLSILGNWQPLPSSRKMAE